MRAQKLDIPDVVLFTPQVFEDNRGMLFESYSETAMHDYGATRNFIQDNHSISTHRGVLRGLHFQRPPHAQAKLVRCVRGSILDIALDIRVGSPNFGKHVSQILSAQNRQMLFVPEGFAHGFVVIDPGTEVLYKCSAAYEPTSEAGVIWSDPELGIDWGRAHGLTPDELCVSTKDALLPTFADTDSPFVFDLRTAHP